MKFNRQLPWASLGKASAEFYLRKLLQVEILLINFYEKKFGKVT